MRRRPLYSACNEDTRSELHALAPCEPDTVVCVAAGGGRVLSLLSTEAARFVAVDRRPAQLHALELKAAALDAQDLAELRGFLGVDPDAGRLDHYAALRGSLSRGARRYWDARRGLVERGVLYAGRTETWLARCAALLRRAGHFEWPAACFAARHLGEQRGALARHRAELARGERAFGVLLHPLVAWLATQDPSFLRSSEGNVGRCLYRRLVAWGERHLFRESFLLHLVYHGRYDPDGALPIYLTAEGAERARKRLGRLALTCSDLVELPRRLPRGERLAWSLSDVGCWMGARRYRDLVLALAAVSAPGSRFVWRNLAAHRGVPPGAGLRRLDALAAALDRDDRSVFYRFEVAERSATPSASARGAGCGMRQRITPWRGPGARAGTRPRSARARSR